MKITLKNIYGKYVSNYSNSFLSFDINCLHNNNVLVSYMYPNRYNCCLYTQQGTIRYPLDL